MTQTIDRQDLAKKAHANAVAKGFWEDRLPVEHYLMLVITELSEAVQAHRSNRRADRKAFERDGEDTQAFERHIKNTLEDELADAYIRLLDLAEGLGFDIEDDHGGYSQEIKDRIKEGMFTENVLTAIKWLLDDYHEWSVVDTLNHIEAIAEGLGIDLSWHISEKMKYNETRPNKHGKEY